MKWISITKKYPEPYLMCILSDGSVYNTGFFAEESFDDKDYARFVCNCCLKDVSDVTHWMTFSELNKQERESALHIKYHGKLT